MENKENKVLANPANTELPSLTADESVINEVNEVEKQVTKKEKNKKIMPTALKGALAAALVSIIIYVASKNGVKTNNIVETTEDVNSNNTTIENYFEANDNAAMIEKISAFNIDAIENGIDSFTPEELVDLYTSLNIYTIDPSDYARLNYTTKTASTINENFNAVMTKLHDDTMTSTPETVIEVSKLVTDVESNKVINKFQKLIAEFNVSENKKEKAKELNAYIENYFGNNNTYRNYDAPVNIAIINMLSALDKLTSNSEYAMPSNEMKEKIWAIGANCTEEDKQFSILTIETNKFLSTLEDKINASMVVTVVEVEGIESMTGAEIEAEISKIVLDVNPVYTANPSMTEEIAKNDKPDKYPTIKPGEKVTTTIPTKAEQEAQVAALKQTEAEKNAAAESKAKGEAEGGQAGYDKGRADALAGKAKGYSLSNITGDKYYVDGYKVKFIDMYQLGYTHGLEAKARNEENAKNATTVVTPVEAYDQNKDGNVDSQIKIIENGSTTTTTTQPGSIIVPSTDPNTINTEITPIPGYHYNEKGELVDDKTGEVIKVVPGPSSSREKTIEELKELKEFALNLTNDSFVKTLA